MVMTDGGLNEIRNWLTGDAATAPTHIGISTNRTKSQIDDCEDNPGNWVFDNTTDANATALDNLAGVPGYDPVEGANTIKLPSVIAASVEEFAVWEDTTYGADLSDYQNGWINFWVLILKGNDGLARLPSSGTVLEYWIGSNGDDTNNYIKFDFARAGIDAGWNEFKCDLDSPTDSLGTVDWTAIDYQKIKIYNDDTGNFNVYLDNLYAETENVGIDETDTALTREVGTRIVITTDNTTPKIAQIDAVVDSTNANYETLRSPGVFNANAAGDMFATYVHTAVTKTSKQEIKYRMKWTVSGSES